MATTDHTLDPTQGAAIYATGKVALPDDNEKPKADNIRLGDEQLADLIGYLGEGIYGGGSADPDYKITGNGVPPVGGYTPTTRAIWVKGALGLKTDVLTVESLRPYTTTVGRVINSIAVKSDNSVILSGSGSVSAGDVYRQSLRMPNGAVLTMLQVAVDPVGSLDPDTRVSIAIRRRAFGTIGLTTVAPSVTDPDNDPDLHTIDYDLTGIALGTRTIDNDTYEYWVEIEGEAGTNANDIDWHGSHITFELAEIPPAI